MELRWISDTWRSSPPTKIQPKRTRKKAAGVTGMTSPGVKVPKGEASFVIPG